MLKKNKKKIGFIDFLSYLCNVIKKNKKNENINYW